MGQGVGAGPRYKEPGIRVAEREIGSEGQTRRPCIQRMSTASKDSSRATVSSCPQAKHPNPGNEVRRIYETEWGFSSERTKCSEHGEILERVFL